MQVGALLGRGLDVALIVAAILATLLLYRIQGHRSEEQELRTAATAGIAELAVRDHSSDRVTSVTLVLSRFCPYCEMSVPFYRRLAETVVQTSSKSQLVVASLDPIPEMEAYLTRHSVSASRVVAVPLGWPLRAALRTPTVIVATPGEPPRSWIGVLDAHDEEVILKLTSGTRQND